jgi:hypothetical protein
MDGSGFGAWGSVSGIDVTVVGTPFLRSLTQASFPPLPGSTFMLPCVVARDDPAVTLDCRDCLEDGSGTAMGD